MASRKEAFMKNEPGVSVIVQFDEKISNISNLKRSNLSESSAEDIVFRTLEKQPGRPRSQSLSKIPVFNPISKRTGNNMELAKSSETISSAPVRKVSYPNLDNDYSKLSNQELYKPSGTSSGRSRKSSYPNLLQVPETAPKSTSASEKEVMEGFQKTHYQMDHTHIARVAVFLHENFDDEPKREGALLDEQLLKESLPRLGIKPSTITTHKDLTFTEINQTLENMSKENFKDTSSLMVFVLSHGDDNDKVHAKDTDYSVDKIWKNFLGDRCPQLAGKPKIFFIVACRGDRTDSGVKVQAHMRRPSTQKDAAMLGPKHSYTIPTHADMLTVFSTMPGFFSYRETTRGTWYIEAMANELKRETPPNIKLNFTEFLTSVNRRLALTYATFNLDNDPRRNQMKQCAPYTSTLTKTLEIVTQPISSDLHSNDCKGFYGTEGGINGFLGTHYFQKTSRHYCVYFNALSVVLMKKLPLPLSTCMISYFHCNQRSPIDLNILMNIFVYIKKKHLGCMWQIILTVSK